MIDPQTWPPLCGAVAGCGALLTLSGTAKLARTVRGTGSGTAVQRALRLSPRGWRAFQALAGCAECGVGVLVLAGMHPAFSDALMAGEGAVFVALLCYIIRSGVPGDCGCLARRPEPANRHSVTSWTVARAACIGLAGVAGALTGARSPAELSGRDAVLAWAVALVALTALALVDVEPRTPRCRRSLLFPARRTLADVIGHGAFRAMTGPWGLTGDRVLFRRSGCVDELWFPVRASGRAEAQERFLAVKAGRVRSGALALRTAIADEAPSDHVKILTIGPAADTARPAGSSPSGGRRTR